MIVYSVRQTFNDCMYRQTWKLNILHRKLYHLCSNFSPALPKTSNSATVKYSSPDPSKDDFGLRSLVRNITVSVSSLESKTSSVLSNDDLGMSGRHR